RVGVPQQAAHGFRVGTALLDLQDALTERLEELLRFDAKVAVGILDHRGLHERCERTRRSSSSDNVASCAAVWRTCCELVSVSRVVWATLPMAMLTCSTAVACCLVESSISLPASVVDPTICPMRVNAFCSSWNRSAPTSTAFHPASVTITVVFTAARSSSMSPRSSL